MTLSNVMKVLIWGGEYLKDLGVLGCQTIFLQFEALSNHF